MFMTIPFRMGVHATIPFYVDMVRATRIDINGIDMVITAEQSTEIQCAVAMVLQEVSMILSARNGVETSSSIDFNELADRLILTARNGAESHIRVGVDHVEKLAMMLTEYQTDPDLLIEEVKNAVLRNNLVIKTKNGTDIHPTIKMEISDDLVLTVANGIEISLKRALENINSVLELDLSKRVAKIKQWDEMQVDGVDDWKLNHKVEMPFELALDVGIIENDSGTIDLVLYANDDVETILTHPMIIGTIDPKKLGELDPYFIPDSLTE